jgi:hypothetical protein
MPEAAEAHSRALRAVSRQMGLPAMDVNSQGFVGCACL